MENLISKVRGSNCGLIRLFFGDKSPSLYALYPLFSTPSLYAVYALFSIYSWICGLNLCKWVWLTWPNSMFVVWKINVNFRCKH